MSDRLEPLLKKEQVSEPEPVEFVSGPDGEPEVELVPEPEVEPVPEPEVEPVRTRSCQDDDIEPLTGKPFFSIILARSHVGDSSYKYQLILPAKFTRTFPNKTIPVILTRGNRNWEMAYLGDNATNYKKFDQHWRAFVEDNKLKVGDVCVFELMEYGDTAIKFKVQVLRDDFPSVLLDKQDGTIDNPLVIE